MPYGQGRAHCALPDGSVLPPTLPSQAPPLPNAALSAATQPEPSTLTHPTLHSATCPHSTSATGPWLNLSGLQFHPHKRDNTYSGLLLDKLLLVGCYFPQSLQVTSC